MLFAEEKHCGQRWEFTEAETRGAESEDGTEPEEQEVYSEDEIVQRGEEKKTHFRWAVVGA